jgi:uncharacterized protein (DUF1810 family)
MPNLDPSLSTSLDRFLRAQDPVIDTVRTELRAGRKLTHWMWFIFPQLRGLGHSSMAQYYGLADLAEARTFLAHETLGPRLRNCTDILMSIGDRNAYQIFGSPDDLKLCSCLTLFTQVAEDHSPFDEALHRFFKGQHDHHTKKLLD